MVRDLTGVDEVVRWVSAPMRGHEGDVAAGSSFHFALDSARAPDHNGEASSV